MLKQYQKPMSMVIFAEAQDILTLSFDTQNVHGIGENRSNTYAFENSTIWTDNNS